MSVKFNYSKLLGRIVEYCGNQSQFAKRVGISEHSISVKLNNKVDWRTGEIVKACEVLDISASEIHNYFFAC